MQKGSRRTFDKYSLRHKLPRPLKYAQSLVWLLLRLWHMAP